MNKTEEVITEMLHENTGRALCDSGGTPVFDNDNRYVGSKNGYGRNYERNANRDFTKEVSGVLSFKSDYIDFTKNVYSHLVNTLEYDSVMDAAFQAFTELPENDDKCWLQLMEKFPESVDMESAGAYNTYNGECALSQALQFLAFGSTDNWSAEYVLLQVHGGADARGGYTRPRVFKAEESFFYYNDGYIVCENNQNHNWRTDDGYCWYDNGCAGVHAKTQLENYDIINIEDVDECKLWLDAIKRGEQDLKKMQEIYPERADKLALIHAQSVEEYSTELQLCIEKAANGVIIADDAGNGYCPKCGGKLVLVV